MEYEAVFVAFTLMEKLILSINLNVVTREKLFDSWRHDGGSGAGRREKKARPEMSKHR